MTEERCERREERGEKKRSAYEVVGIMALARGRGLLDDAAFARLYQQGDELSAMLWGLMKASAGEG